ncbi:HNH endonuclease [Rhizobacter fulvus]
MIRIFFAYHLTHYFGPFSLSSYHTNSSHARESDLVYVVSGDVAVDGGKDYALEGLFKIHRRSDGPFQLANLKGKPADFQYKLTMQPVRVPDAPIPLSRADWYDRQEVHRYFSSGQNFNPLPTSPDYKERFDTLLVWLWSGRRKRTGGRSGRHRTQRVRCHPAGSAGASPHRAGPFQGRCHAPVGPGRNLRLDRSPLPELLIASHIKPWRDSSNVERLDPTNGLLIAVHVDKLFDRHLLSFELQGDDFRAVVAPRARPVAAKLGVTPGMPLASSALSPGSMSRIGQYMVGHLARSRQKKVDAAPSR